MSKTDQEWSDDADEWFYDLGALAKRVKANQKQVEANFRIARRNRKKIYVLGAFLLSAFLLLAWRSEVNGDRISRNSDVIRENQYRNCLNGRMILDNFNTQQDALIVVEKANPFVDQAIRDARIKAYLGAKIEPLPNCAMLKP